MSAFTRPRCGLCGHRVHGPGGCIVQAGIKTPAESHKFVLDALDAEIDELRLAIIQVLELGRKDTSNEKYNSYYAHLAQVLRDTDPSR